MTNAGIGLVAAVLLPACYFEPQYCEGAWAAVPEEPRSSTQSRVVAQVLPVESTAVDILFVIDDSRSMMDEQSQLGIWSSELFNVLSTEGELPDLHIAVTSSSLPIPGLAGCETLYTPTTRTFLRDVAGPDGRERNYTGTLTDAFAKLARVGDSGCGFEQPFAAARTALASYKLTTPSTGGFLRDDALLLVVFVTDEDDCSAINTTVFTDPYADACTELGSLTSYRCFEHGVQCHDGKGSRAFGERHNCRPDDTSRYMESVSSFAGYLKSLKKDPAQVVVAGIYGKPNHVVAVPDEKVATYSTPRLADVCGRGSEQGTGATPAVRMNALMAEFGGRASHSSICDSELSWAMRDMGLVTRAAATRSHCLRGALVDTDAIAPGIQPSCRVVSASTRTELPFTIGADPACADTETQLAFRVAETASNETLTVVCDVDVEAESLEREPDIATHRN